MSEPTREELLQVLKEVALEGDDIKHHLCEDGKELLNKIKRMVGVGFDLEDDKRLMVTLREGLTLDMPFDETEEIDWEVIVKYKDKEISKSYIDIDWEE